MRITIYIASFFVGILLISSCIDDFTGKHDSPGKIVVDGYIEAGGFAKIILTSSLAIDSKIDSTQYLDIVTTRAKVTITDGVTSEILTLTKNEAMFPPHFYVTRTLRGEAGKTYWLEIIYQGDTIRSKTTIPSEISIDTIWTERLSYDSTKRYIWAKFCDNPNEKNFYRAFTKIQGKQSEYVPTYLSAFNDNQINGMCSEIPFYKGLVNFFDKNKDDTFTVGDTVFIKASTIDEIAYNFWKNYEKEIFNSGNPFAGNGANLISNIEGGIGIWCGYNSKVYRLIIR